MNRIIHKIILPVIFVAGFLNSNAQNIYTVGNSDGFSCAGYIQTNNQSHTIYSVGNDDGFAFAGYAQANNPTGNIYAVGVNDGFGFSSIGTGSAVPLFVEHNFFKANTTLLIIYPNPTNNLTTLQADENELSEIKVYNAMGQDVTNLIICHSKTKHSVVIDLSNLASGFYSVITKTAATKVYKN